MAAASSFSYAQAAKGQGAPAVQSPSTSQDAPAENGDHVVAADESNNNQDNATETTQPQTSKTDTRSNGLDKSEFESNAAVDSESRAESVQDKRAESKRDDASEASRLDRPWRRNDKGTRSSSATTRSVDEQEPRRPRKGKKGKSSDKQSSENASAGGEEQKEEPEAPKIELSEAPIPAVNIWQQRKEAQKVKVPESTTNGVHAPTVGHQNPEKATNTAGAAPAQLNGAGKAHHKPSDKNDRNGSRGNRVGGRDNREGKFEIPPPVNDVVSWPTPETAIQEDKKKTSTTTTTTTTSTTSTTPTAAASTDKVDRPEKEVPGDDGSQKPRQKTEWVTYDYVPTVSFETQIPSMRGSKARGGSKGANGGRAVASAQSSEKASTAAPPKSNDARDRGQERTNGTNGPASVPQGSKRAPADIANAKGDQRRPGQNGAEKSKDGAFGPQSAAQEHQHHPREGRPERGRGGFRGRGGHHAMNAHAHSVSSMAAPSFAPNTSIPTRSQAPYSPPPRQGGQGQMYMPPPPQRGGRGGRNGAPAFHRMSLPNSASRPPPVQTQFAPYEYPMAPMSAVPFQQNPYWDNMVVPMLRSQIEYYFSIENLCKDMYLRARMDSQGFVPLMFIAAFKRMRELSPDTSLIRNVCEESNEIDYIVGEDDCERLRRRHGWVNFVLPMEDRDELARNHGPMHLTWKSRSYSYGPQYNGISPSPYGVTSPHGYPPFAGQPSLADGNQSGQGIDGAVNGHGAASQLSADVPDFSPSRPTGEGQSLPLTNGHESSAAVNGLPNGDHAQEAGQV